jgi:RNA polymerase sigma-70 factor, ECF subfamily
MRLPSEVTTNVGSAAAPDDSVLINLVLTGNAECFGVLMDRHLAVVRGRIRGMTRCTPDADDIMQEVQLKIWRRLGSYRSEASFRTWMTRVAINEALQFYRKANRVPLVHARTELEELTSPSDSPLQACVRAELTERLKAAVELLPAKHKRVVVLHNLQELSLQETAQELQATTPAIKTRLVRAKAALSKALIRESGRLRSERTSAPKRRACSPELAA